MCEFCTAHGEGQKWYLEMKNYAEELLHEELSSAQEEMVNASTCLQWTRGFMTGISLREPAPHRLRGPIVVGRHVALN